LWIGRACKTTRQGLPAIFVSWHARLAALHRGELPLAEWATPKIAISLCICHDPQGLIGTMLIELAGDPLTTFELTAR